MGSVGDVPGPEDNACILNLGVPVYLRSEDVLWEDRETWKLPKHIHSTHHTLLGMHTVIMKTMIAVIHSEDVVYGIRPEFDELSGLNE